MISFHVPSCKHGRCTSLHPHKETLLFLRILPVRLGFELERPTNVLHAPDVVGQIAPEAHAALDFFDVARNVRKVYCAAVNPRYIADELGAVNSSEAGVCVDVYMRGTRWVGSATQSRPR